MNTLLLTPEQIGRAAGIILSGGVAAVPTETVYGLAANALDERAIHKIFAAKGRPENKPVSIFVSSIDDAERFCHVTDAARALSRFWPGPLTLILRRRECVPDAVTAGGEGVGIRVPDDPAALELLRLTGLPLTGTSANLSGEAPAVSGAQAFEIFSGRIDCVVDGGVCRGGVPSTVLDLTGERARIVRSGAILKKELEKIPGMVIE